MSFESSSPETVAACLSPRGTSALAVIGIAGKEAVGVADRLFRGVGGVRLGRASGKRPYYGRFGQGIVDDVVVSMVENHSTPEVRISCHGGLALVDALLGQIAQAGARTVAWQDFAAVCGQSPIEIECREALSRALTLSAANVLLEQLSGVLEQGFAAAETGDRSVITGMLHWSKFGRRLVTPWRVLLYGAPNVGKSSLLNALLGFERAIVAPTPGTTRDVLEGVAILGGWAVELIDGAGLRMTDDLLELSGQARVADAAVSADLRLRVVDVSQAFPRGLDQGPWGGLAGDREELVVGNKVDLSTPWTAEQLARLTHRCSAVTGEGLAELSAGIARRLAPAVPPRRQPVPFTRRQMECLERLSSKLP